ncbi:MAG: Uncharacterised protein [Methanobacteriota archaeon]|nr:MAG: Uncharacterised protein [Euryarchaeota archaeon]
MSGPLPKERKTPEISAIDPLLKSTVTFTVASVALTFDFSTCASLSIAFIAFEAQSGQSISSIGQVKLCLPPYSPNMAISNFSSLLEFLFGSIFDGIKTVLDLLRFLRLDFLGTSLSSSRDKNTSSDSSLDTISAKIHHPRILL